MYLRYTPLKVKNKHKNRATQERPRNNPETTREA